MPGIFTPNRSTHQQIPLRRPRDGLHCLRLKKPFLSQLGMYKERAKTREASFMLWIWLSSLLLQGPNSGSSLSKLWGERSRLLAGPSLASCLMRSLACFMARTFRLLMRSPPCIGTLVWGSIDSMGSRAPSWDSPPFEGCIILYNFSFLHTPRPCRSACSGFSSPFLGRQRSPRVHGPVYTPHGWPSSSAHVRQQPQPGSFTSWQPTGTGGHMDRAFWSHGSHGTYDEPQPVILSRGTTRKETLSSMVRPSRLIWSVCLRQKPATIINSILWWILFLQKVWVQTSVGCQLHPQVPCALKSTVSPHPMLAIHSKESRAAPLRCP